MVVVVNHSGTEVQPALLPHLVTSVVPTTAARSGPSPAAALALAYVDSLRPQIEVDLCADDVLTDPYPAYRCIRDAGPVVHLTAHEVLAVGRYAEARRVLRSTDEFTSAHGIGLNPVVNGGGRRITLTAEGELHRTLKSIVMAPMMPKQLAALSDRLQAVADELVRGLVERGEFDGVADLAVHLPVTVVSHLVGLPEEGRRNMLTWSAATFNLIGPLNERARQAVDSMLEMAMYAASLTRADLAPDSWGALVFAAADAGRIDDEQAAGLFIDYIAPSLDTTIHAISHMVNLLGSHPDQWALVRDDAAFVDRAVEEVLRIEAPVRGFTRVAARDTVIGEVPVAEGERVWVLNGSANRDERHYVDPDLFDVRRGAADHLAFGHGAHLCAGVHLARLEMRVLLDAMRRHVGEIVVSDRQVSDNNILRGWATLATQFTPTAA